MLVREAASDFKYHKQAHDKDWKDERKKRRVEGTQPAVPDWKCEELRCVLWGSDEGRTGQ